MPGLARFSQKPPTTTNKASSQEEQASIAASNGDDFNNDDDPMLGDNFETANDGMDDNDFGFLGGDFGGMNDDEEEQGFDAFNVDLEGLDVDEEELLPSDQESFHPAQTTPEAASADGSVSGISLFKQRRTTTTPEADANANATGSQGTAEASPTEGSSTISNNVGLTVAPSGATYQPSARQTHEAATKINSADTSTVPPKSSLQITTDSHQEGIFSNVTPTNSRPEALLSPNVRAFPTPNAPTLPATQQRTPVTEESSAGTERGTLPLNQEKKLLEQQVSIDSSQDRRNNAATNEMHRVRSPQTVLPVPIAAQQQAASMTPTTTMAPPAPRPTFLSKQPFSAEKEADSTDPRTMVASPRAHSVNKEPVMATPVARPSNMTSPPSNATSLVNMQDAAHPVEDTFMNVDEPKEPPAKPMAEMNFVELVEEFDKNLTIASDKDLILQSEFLDARVAVGAATSEYLKMKGLEWELTNHAAQAISEIDELLLSCAR